MTDLISRTDEPEPAAVAGDARRDALVERLFDATIGTLEMFSVYLGRELGAYAALAAAGGSGLTVDGLAADTGIAPRYAKEWLEQQAVAGLVEHAGDGPTGRRFILPPEHREVLLDADSPAHVGPFADMIAGLAGVLRELPVAYRCGGGVPYSAYGAEFRRGQGGINRPIFANELGSWFDAVPDLAAHLAAWPHVRIADIGCGEGWSTQALASRFPNASVVGYDSDEASIAAARRHAAAAGFDSDRVSFRLQDATRLDGEYHFALVFEALHDFARPVDVLRSLRSGLADGGSLLVVDERVAERFTAPGDAVERLMFGWSVNHCLPAAMAESPSAALGTALRPGQVHDLAGQAGFASCTELPIANDFFRFYRMVG